MPLSRANAKGVTMLLRRSSEGDLDARGELIERLYPDLRRLAARMLDGFRSKRGHTMQATEFVSEAYLRLLEYDPAAAATKGEFFGIYATVIRHVILDYVKSKTRLKRGGAVELVSLEDDCVGDPNMITDSHNVDLVAILQVLERFSEVKPVHARVFELRLFFGYTVREVAELIGESERSVGRWYDSTKSYIYAQVQSGVTTDATTAPVRDSEVR